MWFGEENKCFWIYILGNILSFSEINTPTKKTEKLEVNVFSHFYISLQLYCYWHNYFVLKMFKVLLFCEENQWGLYYNYNYNYNDNILRIIGVTDGKIKSVFNGCFLNG